jgi:hypothetical protein
MAMPAIAASPRSDNAAWIFTPAGKFKLGRHVLPGILEKANE